MATPGSYGIWIADDTGAPIEFPNPPDPTKRPDPKDERAVQVYAGPDASRPTPPRDQEDLRAEIDKVVRTLGRVYLDATPARPAKFRKYYVRIFQLAQLGLEGDAVSTEMARIELAVVTGEFIDDEAARVKNGHLTELGKAVLKYSALFLWAYAVLLLLPDPLARALNDRLGLEPTLAANFMLLWVGCFLGVWLSYGIRTVNFTLTDLTRTDSDRLLPFMRLRFVGLLTMLVGVMFVLKIVELKIGNISSTDIRDTPLLALLIGTFCGLSEATLPMSVARKATTFVGEIK